MSFKKLTIAGLIFATVATSGAALAAKQYGPGVTDTEIKIGQTMPYSGAMSAPSAEGRIEAAYYKMINDKGGVNGRKINLISLDDGYSPPKTVEATRRLVESEKVLAIVSTLGTPPNLSIAKYLNAKKVPHILILSGLGKWDNDPSIPWSMNILPSYETETKIFVKYILANKPDAKIGILYQNDDVGKEQIAGLHAALGDRYDKVVVKEAGYDITDTSIDSQVVSLQASGANVFLNGANGKFPALAFRKAFDIGWKPLSFLFSASNSLKNSIEPAGEGHALGVITTLWMKPPGDPQWANDQATKDYLAFMQKNVPNVNPNDTYATLGYTTAQAAVLLLQRCGDNLTRENLMKQATTLSGVSLSMMLPGVTLNNTPTSRDPVKQFQLAKYDGKGWALFGPVVSAVDTGH
ncbi:MAG: ABC transporter substrate-binding protein [Janthinobacterium lividum]